MHLLHFIANRPIFSSIASVSALYTLCSAPRQALLHFEQHPTYLGGWIVSSPSPCSVFQLLPRVLVIGMSGYGRLFIFPISLYYSFVKQSLDLSLKPFIKASSTSAHRISLIASLKEVAFLK